MNAKHSDLIRWIQEKRSDILQFFEAYTIDGNYVNCSSLAKIEDVSKVLWTDMINQTTEDYYTECPFLRKEDENHSICSIQETKPVICSRFCPWEWGENGKGFSCPVVERKEPIKNDMKSEDVKDLVS